MLPSPDQNLKIGSVGHFFFFFLRTVRELSFPIFFFKFLNGENSGGMQSKRIYKCFFKPLNTNSILSNSSVLKFENQYYLIGSSSLMTFYLVSRDDV